VNVANNAGQTALSLAIQDSHTDIAVKLRRAGTTK